LTSTDGEIPDRIGRYEVVSLIGVGGYAKVYKARLRGPMGFTKMVALKVTSAPSEDNSKQVKALINEARICGRLQHPNIIEVYEFGRWEKQYFIAMEFIDGVPLDQVILGTYRGGDRIPAGFAIDVLGQVCRGLRYAHRVVDEDGTVHQVIHRDLKPGNLMLTAANVVKVMDFGIAKSALSLTQTMEGFTKGTPMYMSPEQVHGEPLTPASDIYTLGIVLYEMLTGKRLFAARNLMEVIEKIALSDVDGDIREHAASIGKLEPTLRRMLAHDPGDRFLTSAELLEALEDVRLQVPPGPSIASVVDQLRGPMSPLDALKEELARTPSSAEVTQPSISQGWSVVLPSISQDAPSPEAVEQAIAQEAQPTVSVELLALKPLKGDEE